MYISIPHLCANRINNGLFLYLLAEHRQAPSPHPLVYPTRVQFRLHKILHVTSHHDQGPGEVWYVSYVISAVSSNCLLNLTINQPRVVLYQIFSLHTYKGLIFLYIVRNYTLFSHFSQQKSNRPSNVVC